MKKRYILFILLGLFVAINVNAKEVLTYDWSLKQGNSWWDAINWTHTAELEDSYITATLNGEGYGVLRRISKDGKNIIWETPNYYGFFYGGAEIHGEYIYCLYLNSYDGSFLAKYDFDGNFVDEIFIDGDTEYYNPYIYGGELLQKNGKLYIIFKSYVGLIPGITTDNRYVPKYLYTISINDFAVEKKEEYQYVDKKLIAEISDNREELISENLNDIYIEPGYNIYIYQLLVKNDKKYFIGQIYNDNISKGIIIKTDNNNNIEWVKKSEDDNIAYYDGVVLFSNYVAVTTFVGYDYASYPNGTNGEIRVYDKSGNLVEVHNLPKDLHTNNGDLITLSLYNNALVGQVLTTDGNAIQSHFVKYSVNYEIEKKITGDGKVDIVDMAKPGDIVNFVMKAGKNSILKSLKITDELGNEIKYNGSSFTMPESDVTIEASFVTLYNIISNIQDNGRIDVVDKATEGENVFFKVIPNQGYVVKSMKVITNDGKVIEIANDSFVMPNSDVYINVKIAILENPKTGIINHIFLIVVIVSSCILGYKVIKQKQNFRQIS